MARQRIHGHKTDVMTSQAVFPSQIAQSSDEKGGLVFTPLIQLSMKLFKKCIQRKPYL
jgi:hypothetical protein